MPDPVYGKQKSTGKRVMSTDGGKTWVPAPDEAAPAPAGAATAPAAPAKKFDQAAPGSDQLGRTLTDVGEKSADFARGVGTGLAFEGDDEIAGAVNWLGTLIGASEGGYEGGRKDYQAKKDAAYERNPVSNVGGQITGGVLANLAAAPAQGATAAGRGSAALLKARQLATASKAAPAIQGAVTGALAADPGERLEGAAEGGATGYLLGRAGEGLAGGAKRLLSGETAQKLQKGADKARVSAANLNPFKVAEQPGGVARQAATQRKLGIGKGLFDTPGNQLEQAEEASTRIGTQRATVETEHAAAPVDRKAVATGLRREAGGMAPVMRKGDIGYLQRRATEFEGPQGPRRFSDLNLEHKALNEELVPGSPAARTKQPIASVLNDEGRDALNRAKPGAGDEWRELGIDQQGAINAMEGLAKKEGNEAMSDAPGAFAAARAMQGHPAMLAADVALGPVRGVGRNINAHAREKLASAARLPPWIASQISDVASEVPGTARAGAALSEVGNRVNVGGTVPAGFAGRILNPQDHYEQSMTNPAYRAASLAEADRVE